jgi:hypothetical protein
MKAKLLLLSVALPLATFANETTEPSWGLRDFPDMLTPSGATTIIRQEVRSEIVSFRSDVADLRALKPDAVVRVAISAARLGGADAGALTAVEITYHLLTTEPAPLDEAIDAEIERAPDRAFRRVVKTTLRGGDIGDALRRGATGRVLGLVPSVVRELRGDAKAGCRGAEHTI